MTVTVNTLGTNSRQIVIDGETSATNIIAGVNTALVALGWTLYDTVTSGTRGLLTIKVYSAANNDGPSPTTKYMIIRYDLPRQCWFVSCCESWNATTHVATNESWYGGRQILLPLQYSNCVLYVFATARYACFMGSVRGETGSWQGVFEFEREASEDAAAKSIPCFGWTSSLTIGEPYGNFVTPVVNSAPSSSATSANNGFTAVGFAPPRTANSLTGLNAANNFVILTGLGEFPPSKGVITLDWNSGGITQALNSHTGMLGTFNQGNGSYVWNTTATAISNLKLGGYTSAYVTGKIYGLKITGPLGAPLNTTVVPVDANLFFSAGGTNTTHYLLGIHGGYKDKLISGSATKYTPSVYTSGTSLGSVTSTIIIGGRFIYISTTSGFHKFDAISLTYTYNILPAAAYYCIRFDGATTLYVSTQTTTLYKINLSNDTYTTLTTSVATALLAIDDDNLYAGSSATGTTANILKISQATFTETTSWTVTVNATATYLTHLTAGDYAGYLYAASVFSGTNSNNRIVRILTSNGSNSALTPAGTYNGGTTLSYQPLFYDGESLYFFGTGVLSTNVAGQVSKVRVSDFTLTTTFTLSGGIAGNYYFGTFAGALYSGTELPPVSGLVLFFNASTSSIVKFPLSDPKLPSGIAALPIDLTNFDSVNSSIITHNTDHCTFYAFNAAAVIRYINGYQNYNFNGAATSNLLIAQ